jgi:hypothetical protein
MQTTTLYPDRRQRLLDSLAAAYGDQRPYLVVAWNGGEGVMSGPYPIYRLVEPAR